MSSDASAKQHKKHRSNRRVEEDGAEYEEREVVIYDNAAPIRHARNNFHSQEGVPVGPHTQNHRPVHRESFRGAAVCLGVLCLLMMGVIIFLSINCFSVTLEKEQLQTTINNLSNGFDQSETDVILLQGQITDLSVNHSRLQDEIKKLKIRTKECCGGWKRFGSSCYFKSTEKRKWNESRTDCEDRGSHLVIINSKEEQDFVTELSKNEESWIGLRTVVNRHTSTGYEWEWVDDSELTERFWATGELENPTNWFAAVCCDQQGKWTRGEYSTNPDTKDRKWICEK